MKILLILLFLNNCFFRPNLKINYFDLDINKNFVSNKKYVIGITKIQLSNDLNKRQIITKDKNNKINISEFNRWVDTLPNVLTKTLIKNISLNLPNSIIENRTFTNKYNYIVYINIIKLESIFNEYSYIEGNFYIKDKNNNILTRKTFNDKISINNEYENIKYSYSKFIENLSKTISNSIDSL